MKKTILIMLLGTMLFADLKTINVTKDFFNKNIKVIDIRTKGEWKETGIIKNAYTIEFFDERGQYNVPIFLSKLNSIVKKNERFAIICRTGSRTRMVGDYLGNKLGYKVINLNGGILSLQRQGYKLTSYEN